MNVGLNTNGVHTFFKRIVYYFESRNKKIMGLNEYYVNIDKKPLQYSAKMKTPNWKKERGKVTEPHVEAGSNTFTVALRIVGDDEKGTQFLGVITGPLEDINTGTWPSRLGGDSNLRQQNMVMNPAGLGPENDCTGEGQQL
jgi:hypothetical protein